MTRPLRHRRCEIENAGRVAKELGLAVRLEIDGAITLIPEVHKPSALDTSGDATPSALQGWRERRNADKARGRP